MMRILMSGATGFVGSALVKQLLLTNKNVAIVLLTRKAKNIANIDPRCQYVTLDNFYQWQNLNNFDVVINLAGEPIFDKYWSKKQQEILKSSRLNITNQLTKLILASSNVPKIFLSASAVGYYGAQKEQKIHEQDSLIIDKKDFCHKLCEKWEQAALVAQSEKTRVCILRFGLVLGLQGGILAKLLPIYRLAAGGVIASGKQGMSWVHLDDLVQICVWAIEQNNAQGIYNATAPNPVSNREFTRLLATKVERPAIFKVPAFILRLVFGIRASMLIDGQYVIPKRLQNQGFNFKFVHLQDAFDDLIKY